VGGIGDGTAADDGNLDLVHGRSPVVFSDFPRGEVTYIIAHEGGLVKKNNGDYVENCFFI
jgi:hypothetical protein